jgi:hypothetical protein
MRVRMLLLVAVSAAWAQPPDFQFPGGFGGGRGGPGGPGMEQTTPLLKQYDKNGDGWLNGEERKAAREAVGNRGGGRGFGPRGGFGGNGGAVTPNPKLTPADVKTYKSEPLYDPMTLRTLFLEFENADWEKDLMAFHNTDVEVPAKLTVDGKVYPDVGVHFRGMSSFMMVPEGRKHSINLSMDFRHSEQRLGGYKTLNLLNANDDPSLLHTVLYLQIMREYTAAPKANFLRVVINGENWGIYSSQEQFNGDFIKEWFETTKGARWKATGNPGGGGGGLIYSGDDPARYKRSYELKTKDDPKVWTDLINLCKVLNQTPPAQLEKALEPILDVDGALKWLAVEKALINNDGYWIRASDFSIYQDLKGKFHLIPHDANETLTAAEGGRGGGGGGVKLDPLSGINDSSKPLISKLLAVPALRERYLRTMRDVTEKWLSWDKLGPIAQRYHDMIAADVKIDNRKLGTTDAFEKSLTVDMAEAGGGMPMGPPPGFDGAGGPPPDGFGPPGGGDFGGPGGRMGRGGGRGGFGGPGGPGGRGGGGISLKSFVEQRRDYLLNHEEIKKLAK